MNEYFDSENKNEKPPKRKFWQNLLIMDSGDLKKILSLSSMMLSFVILIVYIVAYIFLMPLLDRIIGGGPILLVNLIEAVIPALIATCAVMLTCPLFKDKRVLPAAYLWLILLAVILFTCVMLALKEDHNAQQAFLYFSLWDGLPALIIGNFAAWMRYRRFLWK